MLALLIAELFNRSLLTGLLPMHFKAAFITSLLKSQIWTRPKTYEPISNLKVLSFVIDHLSKWKLLPQYIAPIISPKLQCFVFLTTS